MKAGKKLLPLSPLATAGVVLGFGLGGFLDGIVLHQILGWHHLVCRTETCEPATIAALQVQITQDGFFHLATWLITAGGIALLFRAARGPVSNWTGSRLFGAMLAGWGAFNLVEGLIDHHILGLHHVRPGHGHQLAFDLLFLAAGAILVLGGAWLARPGGAAPPPAANSAAAAPIVTSSR